MAAAPAPAQPKGATAVLVLADGAVIWGHGFGAEGVAVGEVCFNTAMTGYQEVISDPSYAGQIITFTFPHIGNVGSNADDIESPNPHALGCVVREAITPAASFRSTRNFDDWMKAWGRIGISGVDTRALTKRIRLGGAPNGVIAHNRVGKFDIRRLRLQAAGWPGLEGMDLASVISATQNYGWDEGLWSMADGFRASHTNSGGPHVVAIDYGMKRNILRNLVAAGARVTVVPARTSYDEIMALAPDGVFLSNGPGDPAATGLYAVPTINALLETEVPIFGICLGHQLLGLAVGAQTIKMQQGHRGANHPVKRLADGRVEITSMNHGFTVDSETLPKTARPTHISLFDGSLAGLELTDKPAFSVQYHPEASPGPQDSHYLFEKFVAQLSPFKAA
jgi:carbamoyl-phosphate synthase small subunit